MENLIDNISAYLTFSIGWTIFHSIWIGAIVSVLLFIVLSLTRERKAELRYRISLISLSLFALSVLFVFIRIYSSCTELSPDSARTLSPTGTRYLASTLIEENISFRQTDILSEITSRVKGFLNNNYYSITLVWLIGILVLGLKFGGGLLFVRRIKCSGVSPASKTIIDITEKLKHTTGIRKCVKVINSSAARVPMVIGFIKPYIIIPAGILSGIPTNQVEAIIAHELAHIKRNDFIINIFQSLLEILLFYHPATWWISSVIRAEREVCCDKLAIGNSGDKMAYIKALLNIGGKCSPDSIPAVALAGSDISLLNRIKRITKMKRMGFNKIEKLTSAIMSLLLISGLFIITGFSSNRTVFDIEPASPSVVTPEDIQAPVNKLIESNILTDSAPPILHTQDTIILDGTIRSSFRDPEDDVNKDVEMTFKKGELTKLVIDGKTIPESDYPKYKYLIDDTKEDMADALEDIEEASEDIEEALKEIEELDLEQIQEDIDEALKEIEEIDIEELDIEIQGSLKEMEEIDIELIMEQIEDDIEAFVEIDIEMKLEEIRESIKEIDLTVIKAEIEEARENMRSIDFDLIKKDFEKSIDKIKDFDKIKFEKALEKTFEKHEKTLEKSKEDIKKTKDKKKKELEKEKKKLEKQLILIQENQPL